MTRTTMNCVPFAAVWLSFASTVLAHPGHTSASDTGTTHYLFEHLLGGQLGMAVFAAVAAAIIWHALRSQVMTRRVLAPVARAERRDLTRT